MMTCSCWAQRICALGSHHSRMNSSVNCFCHSIHQPCGEARASSSDSPEPSQYRVRVIPGGWTPSRATCQTGRSRLKAASPFQETTTTGARELIEGNCGVDNRSYVFRDLFEQVREQFCCVTAEKSNRARIQFSTGLDQLPVAFPVLWPDQSPLPEQLVGV